MPLLPKLTGGVVIRERPSYNENGVKYRRLEFVRPKSQDKSDSWPVVYSSQPIRAVQMVNPYPYYYSHPGQWQPHHYNAHGRPDVIYPQLSNFPRDHPIHNVPAPALTGQYAPRQIEQRPELIPLEGSDSENDIVGIFQEERGRKKGKGKKSKGRSKSRPQPSGHSIFDSSSDEDDWFPKKKKSSRKVRI